MKFHSQLLFSICVVFCTNVVWTTAAAFSVSPSVSLLTNNNNKASSSSLVRHSMMSSPDGGGPGIDMFPPGTFPRILETIQGGGTVKTFPIPSGHTRVQYTLATEGRPLKCMVQLWLGPLRNTHTLKIDSENGLRTPYTATLKFKAGPPPVLKISTGDDLTLPVLAAVTVPSLDRAKELEDNTEFVWDECVLPEQKQIVQGGSVSGGGGAIRTWNIPPELDSVQFLAWARDTGKKSFRLKIEVLQGTNTVKQYLFLQCGGGSQPYHSVIQTPGSGWRIRIQNDKFVEDGKVQVAVVGDGVVGDLAELENTIPSTYQQRVRSVNSRWWETKY